MKPSTSPPPPARTLAALLLAAVGAWAVAGLSAAAPPRPAGGESSWFLIAPDGSVEGDSQAPGIATAEKPLPQDDGDVPGSVTVVQATTPATGQEAEEAPGTATVERLAADSGKDSPPAAAAESPFEFEAKDAPGTATVEKPAAEKAKDAKGAATAESPFVPEAKDAPGTATVEKPAAENVKDAPGAATAVSPSKTFEAPSWLPGIAEAGPASDFAVRFGYWGAHTSGSPFQIGEYQDLRPSPLFDIDALRSDGRRTLDLTITGTDSESNDARVYFYRPGWSVDAGYVRYPHNFGHDPLTQFTDVYDPAKPADYNVVKEDLNVNEDYAIRVQEWKARFHGQPLDNLRVRLDLWGMQKEGERQAKGVTHCFRDEANDPPLWDGRKCHVLSQTQRIDWLTLEIKPVVELQVGPVVAEYSRPMRSFSQDDAVVSRLYTGPGVGSTADPASFPYDIVPSSLTQIDQLKLSARTGENKFYAVLFNGDTHKQSDTMPPGTPERENDRRFAGADVRWTTTAIENVSITTYGRIVEEDNQPPAFKIPGEEDTPDTQFDVLTLHPIDYQRSQLGMDAQWRPLGGGYGLGGLAVKGGYEYSVLHRTYATYPNDATGGEYNEENTIGNSFHVGPSVRWSPAVDTYLRYKWFNFRNPLYGVTKGTGVTNNSLPEHENFVEIGGTWMPSARFMLTGWFEVDSRTSAGEGSFREQSYPFGVNGWWALTRKWTLSAGYARYTNWINQEVNFGTVNDSGDADLGNILTRWNYGGRAEVVSLGATYALTDRWKLVGTGQYTSGVESAYQLSGPSFLSDVPARSREDVATTRLTAGVDYQWRPRVRGYVRYVVFDYNDDVRDYRSGTSNMFLGGATAVF